MGRARRPRRTGWAGRATTTGLRRARKTIAFQNNSRKAVADPARELPVVRHASSSRLVQPRAERRRADRPAGRAASNRALRVSAATTPLPILAVDEPIYRRLPCFLIATVDKFASLPWVGPSGRASSAASIATTRTASTARAIRASGSRCRGPLPPPDLIIQDELHLISGPLGTMVGPVRDGHRRAVHARGGRPDASGRRSSPRPPPSAAPRSRSGRCSRARGVDIFPPPGPDRRDSFFAETVAARRAARPPLRRRRRPGAQPEGRAAADVPRAARRGAEGMGRGRRREEPGQPGRPVHDAARLLQQPARAGRQPPHRRGRGRVAARAATAAGSAWARRDGPLRRPQDRATRSSS